MKFCNKFYRKSLQDDFFDQNKDESLCSSFNRYVDEKKIESFLYMKTKIKLIFLLLLN